MGCIIYEIGTQLEAGVMQFGGCYYRSYMELEADEFLERKGSGPNQATLNLSQ